jgi:hypothetical protein
MMTDGELRAREKFKEIVEEIVDSVLGDVVKWAKAICREAGVSEEKVWVVAETEHGICNFLNHVLVATVERRDLEREIGEVKSRREEAFKKLMSELVAKGEQDPKPTATILKIFDGGKEEDRPVGSAGPGVDVDSKE